jgi:phage-related minor tail protein
MPDDADDWFDGPHFAEEIGETLTVSARTFSRVISKGMKDAVIEGHSLERILRRAALSISSSALRAGLRPLTNMIGQGLSGVLGGLGPAIAGGLTSSATKMIPFAEGGVIGEPTAFRMSGGRVGLMGEAGREAVLPLARGTDGRLGVALEGGSAAPVNVTVNIETRDADSFARSEAQVTAMLARAVARGQRGL